MAKDNIILVGFMGTGKTAVGKRLASVLNKRFWDADKEIEKLTGMTLMRLYHKYGQVRFQSEEDLMLRKLVKGAEQRYRYRRYVGPDTRAL